MVAAVLLLFWLLAKKASFLLPARIQLKLQNVHVAWLLWRSYNSFLTTAHTFISWRILAAFLWDEVGGVERLRDFLEIEKNSSRGRAQLAVAAIMCIIFTAGYPLFLLYHLYRTDWGRTIGHSGHEINHVLGHLVADYEPGKRHLVLADLMIKLLQVIVLRFGQSVTAQSIVFTLLLLAYFCMQVFLSPYRVELEDAQEEHSRLQVSVHVSMSDQSVLRSIYFKLASMQLKHQASAWMFSLALVVLLLGLISIFLEDNIVVGVLTLIVIASMIFICFFFAFRAFRARSKKDQLDDVATQDRPVIAHPPFETEMGPMNTEQKWTRNSLTSPSPVTSVRNFMLRSPSSNPDGYANPES